MKVEYLQQIVILIIAATVMSLGIISCKESSDSITGNDDIGTSPTNTNITSSFESEVASFLPGQVQLIKIKGYALEKDEYEADISNGTTVTLYRYSGDAENKTLVFVVPEETPKDHALLFTLKGQEQSLGFTINEYEIIENPKETIDNFSSKLSADLEALYQNETNSEVRAFLQKSFDRVNEEMKKIENLSEEEVSLLARIITTNYSNYSIAYPKQKSYSKVVECSELKATIVLQKAIIATTVVSSIASVDSIFLGGGLIAAITGGVSLGTMAITLEYVLKIKENMKKHVSNGVVHGYHQVIKK